MTEGDGRFTAEEGRGRIGPVSDTPLRYVAVVGLLALTSIVYQRLWLDLRADHTYRSCTAELRPGAVADVRDADVTQVVVRQWAWCGQSDALETAGWAAGGIILFGLLTIRLYAVAPERRIRRCKLRRLSAEWVTNLTTTDSEGSQSTTVSPEVTWWLGPRPAAHALAFGRGARPQVQVDAGLLRLYRDDPHAARAIVAHEMAHIFNGDVRSTYLTVAAWRAFLVVTFLPYVLVVVGGRAFSNATWWPATVDRSTGGSIGLRVGLTAAVAYLLYTAVLRERERHADAAVGGWHRAGLARAFAAHRTGTGTARRLAPIARG